MLFKKQHKRIDLAMSHMHGRALLGHADAVDRKLMHHAHHKHHRRMILGY
jgi:hypothetical protein